MRDLSGFGGFHRRGGDHGVHLLRVNAARRIFVLAQADAGDAVAPEVSPEPHVHQEEE